MVAVIAPEFIVCVVMELVLIAMVLMLEVAFIVPAVIVPEPAFIGLFCVFIVAVVTLRDQSTKCWPTKFI